MHHVLFIDPQIPLFSNFFIKNGSYSTIYTFKNYFATVISIISFQFQQNKSYPNRPKVRKYKTSKRVKLKNNAPTISLILKSFLLMSSTSPSMMGYYSLAKIYLYKKFQPTEYVITFFSFFWIFLSLSLFLSVSSHKTKKRRQQNSSSQVNVLDDSGLQSELASTTSKNIS